MRDELFDVPAELVAYAVSEWTGGWELVGEESLWSIERTVTDDWLEGSTRRQVLVSGLADYRLARSVVASLDAAQVAIALATDQHAKS